nr:hypothetical protein [Tanacetum cinerariifolium]
MDTLSLVSMYLNGMEDILDDGDSMEARKLTVEKVKEDLELFRAHKSFIVNEWSHRVVVFNKEPPRAYSRPFIRFSLPCDVDGQGAQDAELDMADSFNYITKERFDQLGFVRVDHGKYKRKMVKEVHVEIHGFMFLVDFVVIGYANKDALVKNLEEVGSSNGDLVKMGKKVKEVLDRKYKELEGSKPILEVLENYMTYRKKLDEVLMGRARLNSDDYVNGTIEMNALADTGASVSVLPFCLFINLGIGDPKPYNSNLTMADNTQAKAMGKVKNVRIQIGTCGVVIDMWRGTLCIDDGVIRHTYFPKPRAKAYLDNFTQEEEDDWLSCFEVGRDEDGNPKYGPVAPLFLDIKDDMESALAMEAYFNPFKIFIIFKKLIDFLGSLSVQLKNIDWGNEGYGTYKKITDDGDWHAKFEMTTPKNNLETTKNPTGAADMCQPIGWESDEASADRLEVCAGRLEDRALSIYEDVFLEWYLEFFSTMYFDRGFDRTKLMTEKCIWFRLYGLEKVLTLPSFMVLLGLYEEYELNHRLFAIHFTRLEVDDKLFNHEAFWQKIGSGSKERCLKENTLICRGHYVTKIAHSLGNLNDEEAAKSDQSNFAYPAYEPSNIPLYPYPYVPYPHPYTHYPYTCSPSFRGDHYGAHGDSCHASSIVPSLGYVIGGSSAGFHGEDFDPIMHSVDCVESKDDEKRD